MWYLIVPPIIVVLSLLFVLWYLSRQGADPFISKKVSQLELQETHKVAFSRTKNFFLRLLEKTAYRFKVVSLQMHNTLNDLTQSLKERRRHFQEKVERQEEISNKKQESLIEFSDTPVEKDLEEVYSPRTQSVVNLQRAEKKKVFERREFETEEITPVRPMVSDKIVRPEVSYQKTSGDIAREERLIARIAVNPKDYVAYEELGDYYLETGNVKDAKECYRQVLKLSPAERMVKIKIRRLEKILLQKGQ